MHKIFSASESEGKNPLPYLNVFFSVPCVKSLYMQWQPGTVSVSLVFKNDDKDGH